MKSRHQFTKLAQFLLTKNIATHVLDVRGTGDSPDELAQATWEMWRNDVAQAFNVVAAKTPNTPVFVIGLRLGALLALDTCAHHGMTPAGICLWEPQFSGKLAMKQFMRIANVGAAMTGKSLAIDSQPNEETSGKEVGGYWISSTLEASVANASAPKSLPCTAAQILRISSEAEITLPPAWETVIAPWRDQGAAIEVADVQFPAFWATSTIMTSPAITDLTAAWISAQIVTQMKGGA